MSLLRLFFLAISCICVVGNSLSASSLLQKEDVGQINVKDFGAKGDGKNDESDAFQKAFDYIATRGGLKIVIPGGIYLINRQLLIKSNVTIEGAGNSILKSTNSAQNSLLYTYGTSIRTIALHNLKFDMTESQQLTNILTFNGRRQLTVNISDCEFNTTKPVILKDCVGGNIINCRFYSKKPAKNPICRLDGVTNFTVSKNKFEYVGGILCLNPCSRLKIVENTLSHARGVYPIHFHDEPPKRHSYILIANNILRGDSLPADAGGSYDQISCFAVDNLRILGNKISGGGDMGITVRKCSNVLVDGNECSWNMTSGITIGAIRNCIISNNKLVNNGRRVKAQIDPLSRAGIFIYQGKAAYTDSVILYNNHIENVLNESAKNKVYGISVSTASNSVYKGIFVVPSQNEKSIGGNQANALVAASALGKEANKLNEFSYQRYLSKRSQLEKSISW